MSWNTKNIKMYMGTIKVVLPISKSWGSWYRWHEVVLTSQNKFSDKNETDREWNLLSNVLSPVIVQLYLYCPTWTVSRRPNTCPSGVVQAETSTLWW